MPQDEKERGISRAPALGQIILERAAKSPLVEMEAIEGLAREKNIALKPAETRRNLVTHGVPLNHLVGKEFQVGDVRLVGIRLCEPCHYLEEMTTKGVLVGLIHRGGLRANVLTRGLIRVGDSVTEVVKTEELESAKR